jgi:cell division protease FtsH
MEKKTKFNIWYVILAVWGVLFLQNMIFSQFRPRVLLYSEFIQAVVEAKVVEIEVGKDRPVPFAKPGRLQMSQKPRRDPFYAFRRHSGFAAEIGPAELFTDANSVG